MFAVSGLSLIVGEAGNGPDAAQAGTPSMTLSGPDIGVTSDSRKPAAAKSRPKSSAVRSRPPFITIMLRSDIFARSGSFPGLRTSSASRSFPPSLIAARQVRRIATARSSSQSWMMLFSS